MDEYQQSTDLCRALAGTNQLDAGQAGKVALYVRGHGSNYCNWWALNLRGHFTYISVILISNDNHNLFLYFWKIEYMYTFLRNKYGDNSTDINIV